MWLLFTTAIIWVQKEHETFFVNQHEELKGRKGEKICENKRKNKNCYFKSGRGRWLKGRK